MLYDLDVINNVRDELVEKKLTLSVAESVTAGHLQAAFSAAAQASKFFQGGLTAYNAGQKCRHLNVEPISALEENCVSEKVACQMAREVNKLFISDYGIGIAGYATPFPEIGVHGVFAFFAVALGDKIILTEKISSEKENSVDIQVDFAVQVIEAFQLLITRKNAAISK